MRQEDTHLERQGLYGSEAGRHSPTWNGRDPTAVTEEGTHLERQGLYGSEGGRHSPTWNGRDSTAVREEDTWKGRDSTAVREEGTWKGRDSTAVREEGTHLDRLGPTPSHTVAMRVEATHLGTQGLYSSEGGRRSPGKAGTQRQCGRKTLTWKGRDSKAGSLVHSPLLGLLPPALPLCHHRNMVNILPSLFRLNRKEKCTGRRTQTGNSGHLHQKTKPKKQ